MKITWIPVEGHRDTKFIAAHTIATITTGLNGSRDDRWNYSVTAFVPGAATYKLFTGTEKECLAFLDHLRERTGTTSDIARDLRSLKELCKK